MRRNVLLLFSLIFVTVNLCAAQTAKRTITNADLEKYRHEREKSDADYRANYKKLGMPSPEELERQRLENRARAQENLRQKAAQAAQNQDYFQAQADRLKFEITNLDAQIEYLSGQINNLPNNNSVFLGGQTTIYPVGVAPYGFYGYGGRNRFPYPQNNVTSAQAPNVQAAINNAASAPNPYVGTPLYSTGIKSVVGANGGYWRGGYGRPYYGNQFPPYYGGGIVVPYPANDGSNTRAELISNLRYLEQSRAGVLAQLDLLIDEARRAGLTIY